MQVIFHTGVHATDEERLLKCLLGNRDALSEQGISVPGPGKYRTLLKDTFNAMDSAPPSDDARDVLIDAILDDEVADRVIMSNEHFFGSQRFAVSGDMLYPLAEQRMRHLRNLFPKDQIELFLAIRNPASFLPAVLKNAAPKKVRDVLETTNPAALQWSQLLNRIREAVPDVPITVWCNEDTPLIWPQVLREVAGVDPGVQLAGGFAVLAEIMPRPGMRRLRQYLAQRPDLTEVQKRRAIAAFLDKYVIDEVVEEELDLPGWTEALVDQLTNLYDEDVMRLQHIPGVQLIAP